MSDLSSLEVCFDHKKTVVVEISDHSLQDRVKIHVQDNNERSTT